MKSTGPDSRLFFFTPKDLLSAYWTFVSATGGDKQALQALAQANYPFVFFLVQFVSFFALIVIVVRHAWPLL